MDRNKKEGKAGVKGNEEEQREENSESSSSIGINSDEEIMGIEDEGDGGSSEVQSNAFGSLSSLDSALPRNRSLSKFYDGPSRSYTNLTKACGSESVKDIAKPDNAHNRKRKNEIARNMMLDTKSLKKSDGEGIRKGGEMSSLETPTNTNQTSPEGNSENLASSASRPLRHVPSRLGIKSLLSHESSSSASQIASTFTPGWSSSSLADLHGVAAADESNSRLRSDSSSTSFQSATAAAAASDNTRRPDNSSTDLQQSAVADAGSDPDRRLNNSTTPSNEGVDTSPKEPQN